MEINSIPSRWQLTTLGAIAKKDYGFVDGPFGSNLPASDYVPLGVPVIRGSNLSLGEISFKGDEFVYVSEETAKRLERSLCEPEDIIFTKKGTLGQTGFVPTAHRYKKFLISSNQMKLSVDRKVADPRFVYYYVSSPTSREKIIRDSEVTGVPKTNLAYLRTFPILLPPLDEQKTIAHILGTLDDKIELNQQINQTLESIARALFKSWFIDFDPVRAKLDGQQPAGMDAETAALFPAEFEDSAIGQIPLGWSVTAFEDLFLVPVRNGLTKPSSIRGNGTYMVNMGELFANRRIGDIPMDRVPLTQGEAEKSLLETGDLVFARRSLKWDGAGQCSIIVEAQEPRTFEGSLIRCRIDPRKASPWFYFYYFWLPEGRSRIESIIEQVAVAGIRGSDLAKLQVLAPPSTIQTKFDAVVSQLERKISANSNQSRVLVSIRDTLLPKLLSGKIRIKEAEKVLEEVA